MAFPGVASSYPVCPAHEPALRAWVERSRRRLPGFAAGLTATVLAAVALVFWRAPLARALPFLVLGITLVAFPLAAPGTVRRNGVRTSIRIMRWAGVASVVIGLAILWQGLTVVTG